MTNTIRDFKPATMKEVRKIIMDSPNKSCELDPIPTKLLKKCVDELLPLIIAIVNKSIGMGCFPCDLKYGLIRPRLKN